MESRKQTPSCGRLTGGIMTPRRLLIGEITITNAKLWSLDRWNHGTQAVGEIIEIDAKLWSLTGGITAPRRLPICEIMETNARLWRLTGGIMSPRRLLICEIIEADAKLLPLDRWNRGTQAVADW